MNDNKIVRNVYCIYDKLAGEICSPLLVQQNDETMIRAFAGIIADNPQYPCPADYELIFLGTLDVMGAFIDAANITRVVITGDAIPKEYK